MLSTDGLEIKRGAPFALPWIFWAHTHPRVNSQPHRNALGYHEKKRPAACECQASGPFFEMGYEAKLELIQEYPRRDPARVGINKYRGRRPHQVVGQDETSVVGGGFNPRCSTIANRRVDDAVRRIDHQGLWPVGKTIQIERSAARCGDRRGQNHLSRNVL